MKTKFIIFIIGILFINSCGNGQNQSRQKEPEQKRIMPYNLSKPVKTIVLPGKLREISALSYYKDNLLACLQDENGIIYLIDYQKGKVVKDIKISGRGDFEGIEIIGDTAYMMKSNGKILRVEEFESDNPLKETFDLEFSSKNDCEGLGYYPEREELLIACKGKAALPDDLQKNMNLPELKKYRAVYAVNKKSMKLNMKPEYLFEKKEYEKISKTDDFKPSAIAMHPVTGNVYILASAGKLLVLIDKSGNYLEHINLNPKVFRQPEGICFTPSGDTLFIANEGKGGKGTVLLFNKP